MTQINPQNSQGEENTLLSDPEELLEKIRLSSQTLIETTQEFIEWTNADKNTLVEELIRMRNFCDAVIEANPITYSLSSIMTKTELSEPTLRQLLKDVGVDIDVNVKNAQETITQDDLIALLADRAGSREGDSLAEFIRGNKRIFVNC
jgi:uncharacterized Fe-S cluster-containing MiaB family protein